MNRSQLIIRRLRIAMAPVFILLAAMALASMTLASKTTAAETPDISGFWALDFRVPPDPELMAKIGPNTAVIDDTGPAELPAGDYGGLKLKPEALAAAKQWDPVEEQLDISKVCLAPSIVYTMQGPFPMEIYQSDKLIVMKMEYYDLVRVIFLDGRSHPPASAPHSKVGHSVGRWEGDTLVVDTTHISASTFTNNGADHSDNVHVIERFRLSDDGNHLLSTAEYEDPDTLENRGARFIAWRSRPGQYVFPYECDPSWVIEMSGSDPSK